MSKVNWDFIFNIGGLAGLASFLWLAIKDIKKFFSKPKLKISFNKERDLKIYFFEDTHWTRKFVNLQIKNTNKNTARRCVSVLKILGYPNNITHLEEEYALHWAGVTYSNQTTGAEPVEIGPEPRRLDVCFTQEDQKLGGSWIAMPLALSGSLKQNQAYLPQGKYIVEVSVSCENGSGEKKKFKIISPSIWDELEISELK